MKKLGELHVPRNDVNSLAVDREGFLFYQCAPASGTEPGIATGASADQTAAGAPAVTAAAVPIANPPVRHSKPGASNVVYLDFNGHTVTGTAWNTTIGSYVCVPFDQDGDATTFSDAEQTALVRIWERVAEDFAPFDVDVTTEEPVSFTARTARVLITRSVDANGVSNPSADAGGVAYLDVFGTSAYATRSPAFVYYDHVGSDASIAEVAGHEAGHNLGLSHDGTATQEYYPGHGAGPTSWAPIMGSAYGKNVTQWSKGEYFGANNPQDDLAIIAGKLGARADDHADTRDTAATGLAVSGDTFAAAGVIGLAGDEDAFKFATVGGTITVAAAPFRSAGGTAGNNLDLALTLFDGAGNQIASASPGTAPGATITASVATGNYFLKVAGVGTGTPAANPPNGYTSYGSVGQFALTGTVPAFAAPVITSAATASVGVGGMFSFAITATSAPASFTAGGLPAGLAVDAATGVISGRPTALGTSTITVGATNALGTGTATLTLTVADAAPAVLAQTGGLQVVRPGGALTLSATGFSVNGAIAFQWVRNGVALAGATAAALNLADATVATDGVYWLELTNSVGTTRSQAVVVRVRPAVTQVRAWGYALGGSLDVPAALGDVVAIAAGSYHALALRADGSVVGWGDNSLGAMPSGLVAMAIAAGDYHSLVLRSDGTVVAWGSDSYGQSTVPAGLTNVVAIAAGGNSSLAIKSDGTVVAWGFNANRIPSPLTEVRALAAGGAQGLALRGDGSVVFWDDRGTGQSALPAGLSGIVAISAGNSHALALAANGSIFAWGGNASGQTTVPTAARNAVAIAGAGDASLALKADGTVVAWGSPNNLVAAVPADLGQVIAISGGGSLGLALRDATGDSGPTIAVAPAGGLSAVGASRTFAVVASGPGGLAYQWRKDGAPLPGATGASLLLPSVQLADAGSYDVIVRNHFAGTTSAAAVLTVEAPPAVTTAPAARRIGTPGQPLSLAAAATSANGPLRFQWKKNNRPIVGATTASFAITSFTNADAGAYTLEITDAHGLVTHATTFVQPNLGRTQVRGWGFNGYNGVGARSIPDGLIDAVALATGDFHAMALKADGAVVAWGQGGNGQTDVPAGLAEIVAIATGGSHALALKADGTVAAWGFNGDGQTTVPAGLRNVIAIAAGDRHSLALKADGTLVAWGSTYSGRTAIPAGLGNVTAIAAGGGHNLALRLDGTVVAWGADTAGQYAVPANLANVTAIAAGYSHSMAVKTDGTVVAWGVAYNGENSVPAGLSGVAQVADGASFSMALKADGTVVAWGSNYQGQSTVPAGLAQVLAISAGSSTALALRASAADTAPAITAQPVGAVAPVGADFTLTVAATGPGPLTYQWRKGGGAIAGATGAALARTNLQLADTGSYDVVVGNHIGATVSAGAVLTVEAPPAVIVAGGTRVVGVVGQPVSLAATATSANLPLTYQWKKNNRLLAGATTASFAIPNFSNADAGAYTLEITDAHGLVTRTTSFVLPAYGLTQVRGWGNNSNGQLNVPPALGNVGALVGGNQFSLALRADGTVVAWGYNGSGQTNVPAGLANVVAVAVGDSHALALKADGTVIAWGYGRSSQTAVPTGLAGVIAISAGASHSLALKSDGTVVAWGSNDYRQAEVPAGLSGVSAIAAGKYHTLALKTDGTVAAWGNDYYGQVALPAGLADVTALAGGGYHSLALKSDGTVAAWGNNSNGQTTLPGGLTNVTAIAAGLEFSVALKADGSLLAWGRNNNSETSIPADLGTVLTMSAGNTHSLALRSAGADALPVITTQPAGATLQAGASATMSVSATGLGTLAYQWRKGGTAITGATAATLSLTNLTLGDTGSYDVVVTNHVGGVTSNAATLTVEAPPAVTTAPASRLVGTLGQPLTLTVEATSANGPLAYQWKKNNRPLAGATTASFTIPNFSNRDAGAYTLVITDARGFVTRTTTFVQPVLGPVQVRAWGYSGNGQTNVPAGLTAVQAVAAGGNFAVALKADGTVAAWGDNTYAQTAVPAGLTNFVAIATGYNHTLALRGDGTVAAWGTNGSGQTSVPAGLGGVIAVAAGNSYSLALKADGKVVAWGDNNRGQTNVPATLADVVAVAADDTQTAALSADGTATIWGTPSNATPVLASLTGASTLAAGSQHFLALKADGTVAATGYNSYGQTNVPDDLRGVTSIAAGGNNSAAVKADGTLVVWGDNGSGQTIVPAGLSDVLQASVGSSFMVALRSSATDTAPVITAPPAGTFAAVGGRITLSVTASGTAPLSYQWRKDGTVIANAKAATLALTNLATTAAGSYDVVVSNHIGSVTSNAAVLIVEAPPTVVTAPTARVAGSLGQAISLSVAATSANAPLSYQWSKNNRPIAGATAATFSLPSFANTDAGAYTVAIADTHGLVTRATSFVLPMFGLTQVRGWGQNNFGETAAPADLTSAVAVAGGDGFSLALKADGTVVAWGYNSYGQTSVPSGLTDAVAIAAAGAYPLALKADGSVVSWGNFGTSSVPAGLNGVIAISAGDSYLLALKSDGTVVAWGGNNSGPLTVPESLTGVVGIAVGGSHALAAKVDGTVVAWGNNNSGQTTVPAGLAGIVAVAAGSENSVALSGNGTASSWGRYVANQPVVGTGARNFSALAARRDATLALKSDGTVLGWSAGNFTPSVLPVPADMGTVLAVGLGSNHALAVRSVSAETAPIITTPPAGGLAAIGGKFTFTVAASGPGTLRYQWRKNGSTFAGANSSTLVLAAVEAADAGSYDVVVSNHIGSVTSSAAALTVESPPLFTSTPARRILATLGQPLSLIAAATTANGPLSFQWKKNNRPIAGATTATFTLPSFGAAAAGAYTLEATDAHGLITRATAFVLPRYGATQVRGWGLSYGGLLNFPSGLNDVVTFAAGGAGSLALKADGSVTAWGSPSITGSAVPVGLTNVVAVAVGDNHALALKSDGTVVAWGSSYNGAAAVPADLTGVISIAAAGSHSAALKSDGTLVEWGSSYGSGAVAMPAGLTGVSQVSVGPSHTLALKTDGTVVAWGYDSYNNGYLAVPAGLQTVSAVAAGGNHSLALKADGTVVAWGSNSNGQLTPPGTLSGVAEIAASSSNSAARHTDGSLIVWGYPGYDLNAVPADLGRTLAVGLGSSQALALRDASADAVPTIVAQPAGTRLAVGANGSLTVVATGAGPLTYQWRKDGTALAGASAASLTLTNLSSANSGSYDVVVTNHIGNTTSAAAALVVEAPPVVTATAGARVTGTPGQALTLSMAATSASTPLTYQWTKNNRPVAGATAASYTLANFTNSDAGAYTLEVTDSHSLVTRTTTFVLPSYGLTQVRGWGLGTGGQLDAPAGLGNVFAVAAGDSFSLGLKSDGTVVAWGNLGSSQLSPPAGLTNVVAVAAGNAHAVALKADGTVAAWGQNYSSQTTVPAGLSGVIAIAARSASSYALKSDGSIVAWGAGSGTQSEIPAGLRGVVALGTGIAHTLAVLQDGTVVAWGDNSNGQTIVPAGLSGVTAAEGGYGFSLALRANGTVESWGRINYSPAAVPSGLANVAEISAGSDVATVRKQDGSVVAWGQSSYGQATVPSGLGTVFAISTGYYHTLVVRDASADAAPVVTAQPVGATVPAGGNYTLSVSATGTAPLAYQWRKGGVAIAGATSATLALANLSLASAGSYEVVVSNHLGSATSAAAVLTVEAPPAITAAPTTRVVGTPGQALSLSVSATTANGPLTYQWKKNNRAIGGATSATFTFASFTNADAGAYTVEITDTHGLTTRATSFVLPKYAATQLVAWGGNSYGELVVPKEISYIIAVAGGSQSTFALKSDGTVTAWGQNFYGQTTVPSGLTGVVAVAAGNAHALALKADGTVAAWGQYYSNQTAVPAGLSGVVAISAGNSHSLALKSDGTVTAWGANDSSQATVPAGLSGVVAISAGASHSVALKSDGTVVAWGYNGYGQTNVPAGLTNVVAIAAGGFRSVALRADGTAVSWGNGSDTGLPIGLTNLGAISAGSSFGAALNAAGAVVAWGDNSSGQTTVPTGLANVIALSAGAYHVLALRDASADASPAISAQPQSTPASVGDNTGFSVTASGPGTLTYQWRKAGVNIVGANFAVLMLSNLQPSDAGSYDVVVSNHVGSTTSAAATLTISPIPVIANQSVGRTVLNPGQPLSLSVSASGTGTLTYQWSRNGLPVSGANSATYNVGSVTRADAGYYVVTVSDSLGTKRSAPMFVLVAPARTQVVAWGANGSRQTTVPAGLTDAAAIVAGGYQSLALRANGTLSGWGDGYYSGTTLPVAAGGFVAIATGSSNNLLLKSDGTVVSWNSSSPVPPGLSEVVAVACGYYRFYALKSDGTVVRWDGNGSLLAVPQGLQGVVAIAAYGYYALALKSDGTVVAFGDANYGETTVPADLTGVVAVAASSGTAYALKSDGTVVAWGNGGSGGQLSGAAAQTNVRAIAAGASHALAVKSDGTVVAWGANESNQATVPAGLANVFAIAAGYSHSLALRDSSADPAPTITSQPQSATRATGGSVTFAVAASGPGPFTYQWRKNGVAFFGATAATLSLSNLELADTGSYEVVVSNIAGGTASANATLVVESPPVVTSSASARVLGVTGQPITLSVAANSANGPLTYQWKKNNRPIAGAVASTLTLPSFTNADAGAYTLAITDGHGISAFATTFVLPTYTPVQVRGWGDPGYSFRGGPGAVGSVSALAVGDGSGLVIKGDGGVSGWGNNGNGQLTIPAAFTSPVAVAVGGAQALGLKSDGTVIGWGYNGYGQVTVPNGLRDVIAIATAGNYALALKADGTVAAWGSNDTNQAAPPASAVDLTAIAAGSQHALGLKLDGTVVAWGSNSSGQTAVPSGLTGVVAIAAGSAHSLALKSDGTVVAWGYNAYNQATVPTGLSGVVAVAAGNFHSLALKSDGTIVAWGYSQSTPPSDLGTVYGIAAGGNTSFALRSSVGDTAPVITGQPPSATIALGVYSYTFTVAATGSGTLTYQWRKNGAALANQTGTSCTIYSPSAATAGSYDVIVSNHVGSVISAAAVLTVSGPPAITLTSARRVKAATGQSLTFSPTVVGTGTLAYQWKKNNRPITGANSASYTLPSFQISDAGAYTLEVTDPNSQVARQTFFVLPDLLATTVRGWGGNLSGQSSVPAGLNDAVAIAAGDFHSAALRSNGTVFAWGHNAHGQSTAPADLSQAVAVATGGYHTLALRSDGTVTAWGANSSGQTSVPSNLTGVIAIAAGSAHSAALKSDGTVVVWGASNFSQPYGAYNATSVTTIAAGSNHTLALKVDGTVIAWGNNADGQSTVPSSLTDVAAISAGSAHSLALKSDGTVVAWGRNTEGQAAVPACLAGVVALAANGNYSWALKSDGTQVFWGDVSSGVGTPPAGSGVPLVLAAGGLHALALFDTSASTPPVFTVQPQGAVLAFGAAQTFGATATGPGPITYQWTKNGVSLSDGGNLTGATTAALTLTGVRPADAGSYTVVASNAFGSTPSAAAALTVGKSAQTIAFTAPADQRFTLSPVGLAASATSGLAVSFTVVSGPAAVAGGSLLLDGTGTVTVRAAQAGDENFDPAPAVDRAFTVLPSFDSWRIDRFTGAELADTNLSGPNAVFGADGIPNLVKYALGLEPKQNATLGLPEMSMTATDWVYTYTRPASVTDLAYAVEVSTDLATWTTTGVTHELVSTTGGVETWRARFPLSSAAKVFFRLQVTRP
ncbi:MAG: immunoglobulin domain-containing protein [Opitutae bacterium]|nr:immunoglobulin domain-containing protein [Opitutae bacterium]